MTSAKLLAAAVDDVADTSRIWRELIAAAGDLGAQAALDLMRAIEALTVDDAAHLLFCLAIRARGDELEAAQ